MRRKSFFYRHWNGSLTVNVDGWLADDAVYGVRNEYWVIIEVFGSSDS